MFDCSQDVLCDSIFIQFKIASVSLDFNVADSSRLADWLDQEVSVHFVWSLLQRHFLPQIGRQESVGLSDGRVSGLGEVTQSCCRATALSVAILDTSHLQKLLRNWSADNACTAWSRDELDQDGSALAGDLKRKTKLANSREPSRLSARL